MMKKKLLVPALLPVLCLTGCNKVIYSDQVYGFDTFCSITLQSEHSEDLNNVKNIIEHFSKLTDSYLEYSDINNVFTINKNGAAKTKIEKDLYDCLTLAKEINNETFNGYSPYLFDLSKLYKESFEIGVVPSDSEVQNLLSEANTTSLVLEQVGDEYFASLSGNGKIDLGGIAKGYCLDLVFDYLSTHELDTYLFNMTSSILLGNPTRKQENIKVWISDLQGKYFEAKNCGISTSAISKQFYEIDGVTYSHIVNPQTGSAISRHSTVILKGKPNENAKLDAYTTALMNYTVSEIVQFVTTKDIPCLVLDNGNTAVEYNLGVL